MCKKCNRTGFISHFENQSPLGSGMVWNEEIVDICSCLDNDQCPSCGHFWRNKNKEFNKYIDGDSEIFGCIYCLWMSDNPPSANEPFEGDYMLTLEEKFIPFVIRKQKHIGMFF